MARLSQTCETGSERSGKPAVACSKCERYLYDPDYHLDTCPRCGNNLNTTTGTKFKVVEQIQARRK